MNWQKGRQGTGYFKLLLLQSHWPIAFDIYLLKYPEGAGISAHTDPVDGCNHYRINLVIKQSVGGMFHKNRRIQWGRLHFFRPDLEKHGVTIVCKDTRYVLSLGFARKAHNLPNEVAEK